MNKEDQILRNYAFSTTIANTPDHIKKQWVEKHLISYKQNRTKHKNYKPIKINIHEPNKQVYMIKFQSEKDFFHKTKLESSTLLKIKNKKYHKIKKITSSTKHSYPVGTEFFLIEVQPEAGKRKK